MYCRVSEEAAFTSEERPLALTASIPPAATDTDISPSPVVFVPMDQATPAGIPAASSHAFVRAQDLSQCMQQRISVWTFPVVSSNSSGTDATELFEHAREPVGAGVGDVEVDEAADEGAAFFQLSQESLLICRLLRGERCVGRRVMIMLKTGAVLVLVFVGI